MICPILIDNFKDDKVTKTQRKNRQTVPTKQNAYRVTKDSINPSNNCNKP